MALINPLVQGFFCKRFYKVVSMVTFFMGNQKPNIMPTWLFKLQKHKTIQTMLREVIL